MGLCPTFLSVVFIVRNMENHLEDILKRACEYIPTHVTDYEIILVDNASNDNSLHVLKKLTAPDSLPNLQVFSLIKEVSTDIAAWAGIENALGDFVAVLNPQSDDIDFIPKMLDSALGGTDLVVANNENKSPQSPAYKLASWLFYKIYAFLNGIDLELGANGYQILSRRLINFILQHPQPYLTFRHLPSLGGFSRVKLTYSAPPICKTKKNIRDSIETGMRLLVSTTQTPMRLVTSLSLFGASANLFYSIYVLMIALFKSNVAPGWVSLSLQQSGMFFLVSLVLFVLGEYILHMTSLSNEGPRYHIQSEFMSSRITRKERLNIEMVVSEEQNLNQNSQRMGVSL